MSVPSGREHVHFDLVGEKGRAPFAEGAECIPEQAGPPAGAYACIRVPEEQKTGQQARVAGIKEQLTSLLAQPQEKWLSTAPAARIGRLTTSGMSAGATATTSRDQAQGATGSGARYELQPSRDAGSRQDRYQRQPSRDSNYRQDRYPRQPSRDAN